MLKVQIVAAPSGARASGAPFGESWAASPRAIRLVTLWASLRSHNWRSAVSFLRRAFRVGRLAVTGKFSAAVRLSLCPVALMMLGGCSNMELLNPKGDIGVQEKVLILWALSLMLLVVIPVIVLTLVFAWRYRASNTGDLRSEVGAFDSIEVVVWSIPCVIVAFLAVLIWRTTHSLDPTGRLSPMLRPSGSVVALIGSGCLIYRIMASPRSIGSPSRSIHPSTSSSRQSR